MKAKHQRLVLILLAVVSMIGATLLAMSALGDKAAYFYAPSDVKRQALPLGRAVRLGGMVRDKSITRDADGLTIRFVVEDQASSVPVVFKGIAPDLFKEKSGVVAEGQFQRDGSFMADNLLAKHDEKYMPPQLDGKMHKTGSISQ